VTGEPSVQERYSHGITVLTVGPAGTFTGIAIHHRPLGAVLAFSREMGRRLDGLIEPGHFAADDRRGTTGRTTQCP
jgi:hypothetical protein